MLKRRLTISELLRLRGFPPAGRGITVPVSAPQLRQLLGNVMCVPVLVAIRENLLPALGVSVPRAEAPAWARPGVGGPAARSRLPPPKRSPAWRQ